MKEFAERLRYLRTSKGLTQKELSKATKLSQTSIAYWEGMDRVPNAKAVVILARYFEVTADFLLGMTDY